MLYSEVTQMRIDWNHISFHVVLCLWILKFQVCVNYPKASNAKSYSSSSEVTRITMREVSWRKKKTFPLT